MFETAQESIDKNYKRGVNAGAHKLLAKIVSNIVDNELESSDEIMLMLMDLNIQLNREYREICGLDKEIKGE